jgi:hypothetical protein
MKRQTYPSAALILGFLVPVATAAGQEVPWVGSVQPRWAAESSSRVAVSLPRIDVTKEKAGPVIPVKSGYDVGMWYFPGWAPELQMWEMLAARAPWRMPLLFDPGEPRSSSYGIQYYADGDPRVMDWHVKWMAEHCVNWMMVDWYPLITADNKLNPASPLNKALEVGFLGKQKTGGPPVDHNRFEGLMRFAVMWTNHHPFEKIPSDIGDYFARNYFSQRNYFRIDGKPLVGIWDPIGFIDQAGGAEAARLKILSFREAARSAGIPGVYVAAVNANTPGPAPKLLDAIRTLGLDGAMGYWSFGTSLETQTMTPVKIRGKDAQVHWEDYPSETIPGTEQAWEVWRKALGRDYLVHTTAMQDWSPIEGRGWLIILSRISPTAFEDMLSRARRHIEKNGLRKIITIEAWNEWAEGSYVEPSTEYGFGWLDAIRKVFADQEAAQGGAGAR